MGTRTTATRGKTRTTNRAERWTRLREAVRGNYGLATVEPIDGWRTLGDEGIWRSIVGQVAPIGSSRPWDKMKASWIGSGLEYAAILAVIDTGGTEAVASLIQQRFSNAGVRYAGGGAAPSAKALACASNLVRIRALGGPTRFAEIIANIKEDRERIELTRALLAMVAEKGARDLLMGFGLLRNSIAFDARVMSVLREAKLTDEEKAPSNRATYAALEREIIAEIATPLNIEPVVVDRTLYQRTAEVIAALAGQRSKGP